MTAGQLPWLGGAVIALLRTDEAFMAACHGRLAGAAPSDVSSPYATVQTVVNNALDGNGVAWLPFVQVDGWCAPGFSDAEDPRRTAWDIAAAAARVLIASPRNAAYLNTYWSFSRLLEGPLERVDTTRGPSVPVYGALVRVELKVKLVG